MNCLPHELSALRSLKTAFKRGYGGRINIKRKKRGLPSRGNGLFSDKKDTERSGSAVARNGAACGRFEDLLKAGIKLVYFSAHLLNGQGIAFCMSDENAVPVNVGSAAKLVRHIVDDNLVDVAAVLFARLHLAVLHLDKRLELQQICPESCNGRAASLCR